MTAHKLLKMLPTFSDRHSFIVGETDEHSGCKADVLKMTAEVLFDEEHIIKLMKKPPLKSSQIGLFFDIMHLFVLHNLRDLRVFACSMSGDLNRSLQRFLPCSCQETNLSILHINIQNQIPAFHGLCLRWKTMLLTMKLLP